MSQCNCDIFNFTATFFKCEFRYRTILKFTYIPKNFTNYNLFDDFANVKGSILKLETVLPVVIGSKQAERVSQLYFEYWLSDFFNNIIDEHFKAINQAICSIGTVSKILE